MPAKENTGDLEVGQNTGSKQMIIHLYQGRSSRFPDSK